MLTDDNLSLQDLSLTQTSNVNVREAMTWSSQRKLVIILHINSDGSVFQQ